MTILDRFGNIYSIILHENLEYFCEQASLCLCKNQNGKDFVLIIRRSYIRYWYEDVPTILGITGILYAIIFLI